MERTDNSVFFFSPKFSEYFDRAGAVFTKYSDNLDFDKTLDKECYS